MRQKKTCTGVNSFWLNILFEVLFNREVYCRVLRIALNPNHFIIYDLFDWNLGSVDLEYFYGKTVVVQRMLPTFVKHLHVNTTYSA